MTLSSRKEKILKYVNSAKWSNLDSPISLHIETTDDCFNRCVMCGHWKRKNKTSLDVNFLENFLVYLRANGLETVCFSGGDPLKYEHFNRIADFCSHIKIDYGIVTAGHIPSHIDDDVLKNARWIRVSLDSIKEDKYKEIRGGQISAYAVRLGIFKMFDIGANVELGITIHSKNHEEVIDVYRWARNYGIKNISARTIYSHSSNPLQLKKDDIRKRRVEAKQYKVNFTGDFNPSYTKNCWASQYQLFLRANGEVYPCCIIAGDTEKSEKISASLGSIYETGYDDIIMNARSFTFSRRNDIINICNNNCIPRLNEINKVVEETMQTKNFF